MIRARAEVRYETLTEICSESMSNPHKDWGQIHKCVWQTETKPLDQLQGFLSHWCHYPPPNEASYALTERTRGVKGGKNVQIHLAERKQWMWERWVWFVCMLCFWKQRQTCIPHTHTFSSPTISLPLLLFFSEILHSIAISPSIPPGHGLLLHLPLTQRRANRNGKHVARSRQWAGGNSLGGPLDVSSTCQKVERWKFDWRAPQVALHSQKCVEGLSDCKMAGCDHARLRKAA